MFNGPSQDACGGSLVAIKLAGRGEHCFTSHHMGGDMDGYAWHEQTRGYGQGLAVLGSMIPSQSDGGIVRC